MRAAVFHKPGEALTIETVPQPTITDREMLVKVSHCGICGTDIHASRAGPFMAPPETVFGHEFTGEIVEIGSALEGGNFSLGDRVTFCLSSMIKPSALGKSQGLIANTSRLATTLW